MLRLRVIFWFWVVELTTWYQRTPWVVICSVLLSPFSMAGICALNLPTLRLLIENFLDDWEVKKGGIYPPMFVQRRLRAICDSLPE